MLQNLILASLPLLATSAPLPNEGGITIQLTRSGGLSEGNGTAISPELMHATSYLHLQKKYQPSLNTSNISSSEHNPASVGLIKRASQGSLTLKPFNTLYHGKIIVGGQELDAHIDTGSADLVVPGPGCVGAEGMTTYKPSASVFKTKGKSFQLDFADGSSFIGDTYTDTVSIGGLTIPKGSVGVANEYRGVNKDTSPATAILGFAFPMRSVMTPKSTPLVELLHNEGKIEKPLFALKLSKNPRDPRDTSELHLGWINDAIIKNGITYIPVTQKSYWRVTMQSVFVGETEVSVGSGFGTQAVFDSGADMMYAPKKIVDDVYRKIDGAKPAPADYGVGVWTIPCNRVPSVSLKFGGRRFFMDPLQFAPGYLEDDKDTCVGSLREGSYEFVLLGAIFLRNVYSIYDMEEEQVGLAELKTS